MAKKIIKKEEDFATIKITIKRLPDRTCEKSLEIEGNGGFMYYELIGLLQTTSYDLGQLSNEKKHISS
jgi:hypothetical protein